MASTMDFDTDNLIESCFMRLEPLLFELATKLHEGLRQSLRDAISEHDCTQVLNPLCKVAIETLPATTGTKPTPSTSDDNTTAASVHDFMTSLRLVGSVTPLSQQPVGTNCEAGNAKGPSPIEHQSHPEDSSRCAGSNADTLLVSNAFSVPTAPGDKLVPGGTTTSCPPASSSVEVMQLDSSSPNLLHQQSAAAVDSQTVVSHQHSHNSVDSQDLVIKANSSLRKPGSKNLQGKTLQRVKVAMGRDQSLPDYLPSVALISQEKSLDLSARTISGPRDYRLLQLLPQHQLHRIQKRVFEEIEWTNVRLRSWLRPMNTLMNKQACIATVESAEVLLKTCHASRSIFDVLKALGHCYYDFNNDPMAVGPVTTLKLLYIMIWMLLVVTSGEVTQYKFVRNFENIRILCEVLARPVPEAWWNDWQLSTRDLEALENQSRAHAQNYGQENEDDFVFDPEVGKVLHPDWLNKNAPLIVIGREFAIQCGLKDLSDGLTSGKVNLDRDMDKLQALESRILSYYMSVLSGIVTTCRKDLESAQIYQYSAIQFLSFIAICIFYVIKGMVFPG